MLEVYNETPIFISLDITYNVVEYVARKLFADQVPAAWTQRIYRDVY